MQPARWAARDAEVNAHEHFYGFRLLKHGRPCSSILQAASRQRIREPWRGPHAEPAPGRHRSPRDQVLFRRERRFSSSGRVTLIVEWHDLSDNNYAWQVELP